MNYHNKTFRVQKNSSNGETSSETIFKYKQQGNVVSSTYMGGEIQLGHLLGLVHTDGSITMAYHQVNSKGELLTGKCTSTPEILSNGKIRLHESWKWTSGDRSSGSSILQEL